MFYVISSVAKLDITNYLTTGLWRLHFAIEAMAQSKWRESSHENWLHSGDFPISCLQVYN